MCSGLIINNIMLQILNLSMASKNIGNPLPAFRIVSIPLPKFPSKNFKNPFKILTNILTRNCFLLLYRQNFDDISSWKCS